MVRSNPKYSYRFGQDNKYYAVFANGYYELRDRTFHEKPMFSTNIIPMNCTPKLEISDENKKRVDYYLNYSFGKDTKRRELALLLRGFALFGYNPGKFVYTYGPSGVGKTTMDK
ncbi:MAG: hypothetical protein ACRCXT_05465 [Paraclostridium sp.]